MLKPVGLTHGHYECRALDETLPVLTELLAMQVVERSDGCADELWSIIEPLLPRRRRRPKKGRGRPRVSDRATLTGIVFVLRSGIPWKMLPREMGCGSGVTCWRRLKGWQRAGVWKRLHQVLLSKLRQAERIDFSRAVADSSSIRALGAGKKLDRNQPIAVVPARNITSSSTRKAFRSRSF